MCCILGGSSILCALDRINIVTVNDDFASIATSIGGELVHVDSLISGSRNLHDINPKPSMVMKVKNADMVIRLGMSQDSWMDGLIQVARNPKLFSNQPGYLDASKDIEKLEVPTQNIDGSHGDVHKEGNPHYWLNPRNGIVIANAIRNHLIAIDPTNKTTYDKNFSQFSKQLLEKINQWEKRMASVREKKFMSYHKVWAYFYDAFKLKEIGTLEVFPGVPPTINHLKSMKQAIKKNSDETIIITARYYPKRFGESLARDTDANFLALSTNVGDPNIETYADLFDYLVTEITE